jgi:hypothetical protein
MDFDTDCVTAIDPGTFKSAILTVRYDMRLLEGAFLKIEDNMALIDRLGFMPTYDLVIEKPVFYGWGGKELSETCIWAGRFYQEFITSGHHIKEFITRSKIRWHIVKQKKGSNDSGVIKKLITRFTDIPEGKRNRIAIAKELYPEYMRRP